MSKLDEFSETLGMISAETDLEAILEKELAKEEEAKVAEESIKECIFEYKDEVKFKPKRIPKDLKKIKGLKHGIIGRVLKIIDKDTVQVDFWETRPARFSVKVKHLEIETPAAEIALRAAPVEEQEKEDPKVDVGIKSPSETPMKLDMGKLRMDLIRPEFLKELAAGLTYGAEKYDEKVGEINFLKGEGHSYNRVYAALQRHLNAWMAGEDIDEESGLNHLSLAAANLMMLVTYENSEKGLDDRVRLGGK